MPTNQKVACSSHAGCINTINHLRALHKRPFPFTHTFTHSRAYFCVSLPFFGLPGFGTVCLLSGRGQLKTSRPRH